jgi:thiamine pyrophosphokinase
MWLLSHQLPCDLAIGDFDTAGPKGVEQLLLANIPIQQFPENKDKTDTQLAIQYAASHGAQEIILFGGTGSRFDHSLANVQQLFYWLQSGISIKIVDQNHIIDLVDHTLTILRSHPYVSLLAFTPTVTGIRLQGFKYPLENGTLSWGDTLGLSNELLSYTGSIHLEEGILLVIQSKDS